MCEASSCKSAAGVKTIHLSEAVGSVIVAAFTHIVRSGNNKRSGRNSAFGSFVNQRSYKRRYP